MARVQGLERFRLSQEAASRYLEPPGYLERAQNISSAQDISRGASGQLATRASRWLGPLRMTRSDTRNSPPLRSLRSPRADQSCSCSLGVAYRAVPAGLPLASCVLAFGLPRPGRGSNLRPRLSPSLSLSGFSEAEARAEDGGITRECRSNLLKSLAVCLGLPGGLERIESSSLPMPSVVDVVLVRSRAVLARTSEDLRLYPLYFTVYKPLDV